VNPRPKARSSFWDKLPPDRIAAIILALLGALGYTDARQRVERAKDERVSYPVLAAVTDSVFKRMDKIERRQDAEELARADLTVEERRKVKQLVAKRRNPVVRFLKFWEWGS